MGAEPYPQPEPGPDSHSDTSLADGAQGWSQAAPLLGPGTACGLEDSCRQLLGRLAS